jgi:hypothetical protein
MFITLNDVRNFSSSLLQRTFFVDVIDAPPHLMNNHPHKVLAYPNHRIAVIQSERKEIKLLTFEEMLKLAEKRVEISLKELLENLKSKDLFYMLEGAEPKSKRLKFTFQIFPGLESKQ